ncbi:hypothetical protein GCM10009798_37770 [Nocardioides panacihumi]|uniref:Class F sortase n=1 Tax=Nocardioides panacihumi TaxID=400774 RepID=A0ABN2RQC3_9ACTN
MPDQGTRSGRNQRRLLQASLVAALAAGLLLAGQAYRAGGEGGPTRRATSYAAGATSSPLPTEVRAPWRAGSPRSLRLPTLGVTAPVVPVRAPGRTLIPPSDPATLGWWADGARPGAPRGSVLIAGHTVHGAGKGALEDIGRLTPGAPVVVTTAGSTLRYVVERVQVFDKATLSTQAARLFRQDGPPQLVLITCADWDGSRFLSNVVVVARRAPAAG